MTDYLSRQPFIKLLKNIIENQSKNNNGYSIAIDGDWGSGKTWILDALESQLSSDEYLIFHYNAWENDFYEEPLVALLSVMLESLRQIKKVKEIGSRANVVSSSILALSKIVGVITEKKLGVNLSDTLDAIKNTNAA